MPNGIEPFAGVGTVFRSRAAGIWAPEPVASPMEAIKAARRMTDELVTIIGRHGGIVERILGDDVKAFWHPQTPEHAQFAFDAALEVLSFAPRSFQVAIVLGTGEIGGDYFGPAEQFQVVGAAVAITDRILALRSAAGPSIRMTQMTRDRLQATKELRPERVIERPGLEALTVYAYRPAA